MLERTATVEPPPPGRLRRRAHRLLRMSPTEIAYRTAERLRVEADRGRVSRDEEWALPTRGGSVKQELWGAAADGFFFAPTPAHREGLAEWLARNRPEERAAWREEAERLLRHEVGLLGFGTVDLGPTIDWHRDPLTGEPWTVRFFADYDLVDGGGPDPKVVHELNRHGHLARLAGAFYVLGDERYAEECVAQMLSWIEQNPVGYGIHWNSSLELSLRALAWTTALVLLLPSSALDEAALRRIAGSLLSQLAHVNRYPSLYSSPNTHLIGEATALFVGGRLWRRLDVAAKWCDRGARLLEREIGRQVGPDGAYGEPSSYYHAYALDFYAQALALDARAFSEGVRAVVPRMAEYLAALTRADGSFPLLGDDDGGTAFPLAGPDGYDARDILSAAAAVGGRPELFHAGHERRVLWMRGPAAVEALTRSARAHTGSPAASTFRHAGVFVLPRTTDAPGSRVIFDAGGWGMGGAGHAHADALQVLWDVGGRAVLVDPGTCVYNRAPATRAFFRGTRAHNTVVVDGLDQGTTAGTFSWAARPRVVTYAPRADAGLRYAGGEHDGYERLGVRHRRHVLAVAGEYWLVADVLVGRGHHRSVWTWHLAQGLGIAAADDDGLVRAAIAGESLRASLSVATSAPSTFRIVCGGARPLQGWVSPRYGQHVPAPVLEIEVEGALPIVALTLLRPGVETAALALKTAPHSLALHIAAGATDDVATVSVAEELGWCRRRGAAVTSRLSAHGGLVRTDF
jgi:hypothetical protein